MSEPRPVSFTELLDWVEGRLPDGRRPEVEAGLADPATADAVAWIRSFHTASRLMPLATPPQAARDRLRALVAERTRPWAPTAYSEGALVFDSRDGLRATGTRSGAPSDDLLDWVFETELGRVHVAVAAAVPAVPGDDEPQAPLGYAASGPGRLDVRGEVAAADADDAEGATPAGTQVLLVADGRIRATADCDPAGRFETSCQPGDLDQIWLRRADRHVRLSVPSSPPPTA
jgi:hypothetical protein